MTGCGSLRKPVPLGIIPPPPIARAQDEQYGQQVLGELSQQYHLSRDDAQKDRVEQLVARLAAAAGATNETPWHITVLEAPQVKNAAATRGNFLFVWSGLLNYLRSDEELAVVLSHELSHIMAGHVMPNPAELASQAAAQVGGQITSAIVGSRGYGIAGDLAGKATQMILEALVVNPNARRVESEADEIGLFLLARAGFDPESAVNFWERVQNDPDFGGSSLSFLSSHPSSLERFKHLQSIVPIAQGVRQEAWTVKSKSIEVYESTTVASELLRKLAPNDYFFGNPSTHGWICGNLGCVKAAGLKQLATA